MSQRFAHLIEAWALRVATRVSGVHYVIASWDADSSVWFVRESSVDGLSLEAETPELLLRKVEAAVPELLALNQSDPNRRSIPLRTLFEERISAAA